MQLLEKSTFSQTYDVDANPTKHLEVSTKEYLQVSFLLWEYKQNYSKKEYREILQEFCWDKGISEEKRALKLAEHFQHFAHRPQALIQIPVTTLLKLCSDKYSSIIEDLKQLDDEEITCEYVFGLIKQKQAQLKKEKESQLPEKPSIWRRNSKGQRYAQYPPMYEEDYQTGTLTQKLMDEHGYIPQQILRLAIADFYEKITEGQQEEDTAQDVDESRDKNCEINQNPTVEDKWLELNQQLKVDIEKFGEISQQTGKLIFDNCQHWEAAVPNSKKWSAISNICGHDEKLLKSLSSYGYGNHPEWRLSWGAIFASYEDFEQEWEWVGTVIKIDALIAMGFKITTIVEVKAGEYEGMRGKVIELCEREDKPILVKFDDSQEYFHLHELEIVTEAEILDYYTTVKELQEEEYLEAAEESDIELETTLLDKAIDVLKTGTWEDIRNIFDENPEIKEQAWDALSAKQRKRVVDITPETVKILNQAKKDGVIQEYKEIAVGVYRVKLPNKLLWEQRAFHEIEIRHYLRSWRKAILNTNN